MITSFSGVPKVSVIVPVYQVEKYIERCVRSLMEQTLEEIEYIFVDDCSTDSSDAILKKTVQEYPHRQSSVTYLHNEKNLGLLLTRRAGFQSAKGLYLITCDSDDWVEPDAYRKLYEQAQATNADIVVCDYYQETSEKSSYWSFNLDRDAKKCLQQIHNNHRFSWTIWNQLIRHDIVEEAIQKVYPTTYAEDIFTLMHTYWLASTIAHVPEALYHYNRCNEQSVMTSYRWTKEHWPGLQKNINEIVSLLNPIDNPDYHLSCQWLKFKIKDKLQSVFDSPRAFYYTYKESYVDIMHYEYLPKTVRRKLCVIYSCYPLYWLYQKLKS